MEASDLPLVVPLRQTAFAIFQDDLDELAELQRQVDGDTRDANNADSPPSRSTRASSLQEPEPTKPAPKPAAKPAAKKGGKAPPPATPPRTPQAESLTPEPSALPPPPDPWRRHVDALSAELEAYAASTAPFGEFEKRRLAHFAEKGDDEYMIEDVLCEWDDAPTEIPRTCIDAVAMSRAHTAALAKKYGYVPPRGLHVAGHVRPEDVPDQARHPDLLTTHGAGGDKMDVDFVCSPAAKAREAAAQSSAAALGGSIGSRARSIGAASHATGHSRRAVQTAGGEEGAMLATHRSMGSVSEHDGARGPKQAAPPGTRTTTMSPQTKRLASVRGAGVPDLVVETSLPDFRFPDCAPGTQYELRCRVWNRDTTSRRFKLRIAGDERKLLDLQVLTAGFSTEVAVVPGNSFELSLVYSPVDTEPLNCRLVIGHARDINRVDQSTNALSQWQMHEMDVWATCLTPDLDLRELPTEFEPCFIGASRTIRYRARNAGSTGTLAIRPSVPQLTCNVSEVLLAAGEETDLEFTFAPDTTDDLDAPVTIDSFLPSQDLADIAVRPVSSRTVRFRGEAVAPTIRLLKFASADLGSNDNDASTTSPPPSPTSAAAQLPYVTIEDACVGYTATRKAVVENPCSLPVTVVWRVETLGECRVEVAPAEVTLAPRETREFTLSLLPLRLRGASRRSISDADSGEAGGVESVVSLMIAGVPRAAAAVAARLARRSFVRPLLRSASGKAAPRVKDTDPFALFSPRVIEKGDAKQQSQPSASASTSGPLHTATHNADIPEDTPRGDRPLEHFCAAVRVVADPVPPSAQVTPATLVAEAPALVQQPNSREVVIVNTGPRDLLIWADPPSHGDHPAVALAAKLGDGAAASDVTALAKAFEGLARGGAVQPQQRHDVDIVVTPQRFTVRGGESKKVTVTYTAKRAGAITAAVEFYSPLLEQPPLLSLSLVGRGPELSVNTSILEYGVIPVGGEAEGRLTLTNLNPIPVLFSLVDTHAAGDVTTLSLEPNDDPAAHGPSDDDRVVFLPAAGSLAPKESRDITVYLRGHHAGNIDDKIKIAVEDGVPSYVAIRASVQAPRACITPATVTLTGVQRRVPVECVAYASNLSAVDVDFSIVLVDVPRSMTVEPIGDDIGTLHAGAADVPLRFRVTFNSLRPETAVIALASDQIPDLVPFEVTCDAVEQLRVAVGVTTPQQPLSRVTPDAFCEGLVEEMALHAVMQAERVSFLDEDAVDAANAKVAAKKNARVEVVANEDDEEDDEAHPPTLQQKDKVFAKCHCPPIIATGVIDGEAPFATATAEINVTNLSGCFTALRAWVSQYAPPSEKDLAARTVTPTPPPSNKGGAATTNGKGASMRSGSVTRPGGATSVIAKTATKPGGPNRHVEPHAPTRLAPLTATQSSASLKPAEDGGASVATTKKSLKQVLALSSATAGKTFTCKALNGLEEKEAKERAVLADAQRLLVHGAGFAVELIDAEAALDPHEQHTIRVRLIANVPGEYTDSITLELDNMPSTRIPVSFHVEGKPAVLDPFTSGLTVGASGVAQLQMPPIVPGLAAAKRTLTVTSRCPRDLTITARMVEWGGRLGLQLDGGAGDDTNGVVEERTGTITLTLLDRTKAPPSQLPQTRATITPATLTLPALQTTQFVLQYTPPTKPTADYHASLLITTAPAATTANDRFIVDEFYRRYGHLFAGETKRTLTPQTVIARDGINMRGVPKVMVRPPLIDRKGVVTGSAIAQLDEQLALAAAAQSMAASAVTSPVNTRIGATAGASSLTPTSAGAAAAALGAASPASAAASRVSVAPPVRATPSMDDDDDSDDDGAKPGHKSKADLQLEERMRQARAANRAVLYERAELAQFIAARREEIAAEWQRLARPIEVELHVAHLQPRLVTDPPSVLRFPMCKRNVRNARTMSLTNEGSAPMDFRLEIERGPFRVAKAMLLMSGKAQAVDFAATKLGQSVRGRPTSRESEAVNQLFRLRPFDSLEVTVEVTETGGPTKHTEEGVMNIVFANGASVQPVPLLATVHVPVVEVEHPTVTFRPSVAVAGGRKQPTYTRYVRLVNPSTCAAPFQIRHVPSDRPVTRRTEPLSRARVAKAAQAAVESAGGDEGFDPSATKNLAARTTALGARGGAAEANNVTVQFADDDALPVDDPSHFELGITSGVIEAASAGAKPTVLEVPVVFHEHAVSHFSCEFEVVVDGGVGCRFTLEGESRATEF